MLSRSQKRVVYGAGILVIVVLFVVPAINVSRYRLNVAQALSQAVGREVTVQGISIQTFPQPGLLLTGVTVADDPSISAEPMLRADEVLAVIRLSSLWRGRLEIATLKLKYPSLNIARSNDGRWNLESLVDRARRTPSAPTTKSRPETRPRFPYIESDAGRINLKIGNEKKVFALNEADFAIWLEAEDEWHMRLEARPIRTDANLSDTGTLRLEGSWRRAPQLHETPISLTAHWDYGQLGQLTRLAYGRDRGWRGRVTASASVTGKPENLQFRLDTRIEDFRRYDIAGDDSVTLELHCNSSYDFSAKQVKDVACQMPAGSGVVLAHGSYSFLPTPRAEITVSAENVPMQFLAVLARHAKRDLPSDMNVTGMLSASFAYKSESDTTFLAGNGETSALEVRSSVLSKPLSLEPTKWLLTGPKDPDAHKVSKRGKAKPHDPDMPLPSSLAWRLEPVSVRLGADAPATLAGWFSHDGYYNGLTGDFDIPRLVELAKLAGLPKPPFDVSGTARGTVEVSGEWGGFAPATITADAQLKNVVARLRGVASPLRLANAHFVADKNSFALSKVTASLAMVHSNLELSGSFPQHCESAQNHPCVLQFNIAADQLNTDEVNSLLNPRAQKRPWYAELANSVIGPQAKSLPEFNAQGAVSAGKLIVKSVTLSHFASKVSIGPSRFALDSISADVFGGKYSGELTADFTLGQPVYSSQGRLLKIAMPSVATLMKDPWASGSLNATYKGQAMGWTANDLLSSASGTSMFDWHDGSLPHIDFDGHGKALQFNSFAGSLALKNGSFSVEHGKLQSSAGIYQVSGTASMDRQLELKFVREGMPSYTVSGSLDRPVIAPVKSPTTQAKLKQSRHP